MISSQTWQHGRCLTLCLIVTCCWTAGCGTVGNRLAGTSADFEPYRRHEVHRISLADVEVPAMSENAAWTTASRGGGTERKSKPFVLTAFDEGSAKPPLVDAVQFEEQDVPVPSPLPIPPEVIDGNGELAPPPSTVPKPVVGVEPSFPIDLPTALRLAGANNLQIAFAAERVQQAIAQADAADVLWVPDLRAGLVYNNHAGQIQGTEGEVIDVNRSSLFLGAGAGFGNAPLNAGSSGPARLFVDLSPVDVLFEPLAARQSVEAAQAQSVATFNDTLLQTASAYLGLLRAHALVAISEEAVNNARELARLTNDFARTGRGLQADADRSQAELENRKRDLLAAKELEAVASAELARLLRLDPATQLVPAEVAPIPYHLIDPDVDVHSLIAQAQASRPELSSANANVQETWYRIRQEKLRPWVPHLYAGLSSGGFGGAPGSEIDNFSGRTDFDIAAVWEFQNLGLGNGARQREQESLHRQAHITMDNLRDLISTEVTQAYHRVRFRAKQIETTQSQVESATEALRLNLDGIRGGVIRPIELQQAISALASARRQHIEAILQYNQAQFELLRAMGQPPEL